jgi:predicted ATP-dependent endonuclease of OLD family
LIKKITIAEYRKLKDLEFNFSSGINAISGTNHWGQLWGQI